MDERRIGVVERSKRIQNMPTEKDVQAEGTGIIKRFSVFLETDS